VSTYGNWWADGLVHEIVDDRDDGRELVTKCGLIEPWLPSKNRMHLQQDVVTCFQCMTLEYPIDPRERAEWPRQVMGTWVPATTKET
jgi:hypothetical protein